MLSLHKKRRVLITTLLVTAIALPSTIFAINKAINEAWADEGTPLPVLTYDNFGGVGGPTTSTCDTTNYNPEVLCVIVIPDETPTMEGYTFVGWWTSEGQIINHNSGYSVSGYHTPGESFYIDENTTMHAVYYENYNYKLTLDYNGGSGGPDTLAEDDWHPQHTFTIPNTTPTLVGHTFLGWTSSTDPSNGNLLTLYKPGNVYRLTGSYQSQVTLKAVWQDNSSTTYGYHFLNLDLNGYTSGGSIAPDAMGIYCDASVSGGCSHSLYVYGMVTSLGTNGISDFAGWAETPTATTATITSGTVVDFDDRTIYAVSSDGETEPEAPTTCTIYYYSNASDAVSNMPASPQTVDTYSGTSTCSFYLPTTLPTRSGYAFVGWSRTSNNSDNHIYSAGAHLSLDGNQTFYAQWQSTSGGNSGDEEPSSNTYTLSFNADGGSGAPSSASCTTTGSSCSVTIPSTAPTRSGYTFKGWSLSSGAASASYQSGNSISLNSNQTLYAVWQENQVTPTTYTYTLSYDANGGSGAPSAETRSNIAAEFYNFTVSSTVPTRSGYTFAGWKKSGDSNTYSSGSSVTATSSNPSITLVAQWTENSSAGSDTGESGNTGNTGEPGNSGTSGNSGESGNSSNSGETGSNTGNTGSDTSSNTGSNTNNSGSNSGNSSSNTGNNSSNTSNSGNTTYTVMSGSASKHILNSGKTLTIKGSGDLTKFVNLKIDGTIVAEANYSKAAGSTIVTISPAYLDTLSAGTHTATMVWSDGEVSTDFVVAASEEEIIDEKSDNVTVPRTSAGAPDTGSNTEENEGGPMAIIAILPAAAIITLFGIYFFKFAKTRRNS